MKLDEIRRVLTTTTPADWNRVSGFPTYRDNLGPMVDDQPLTSHDATAAYLDDVRLTLAWGMDPPGDKNPHPLDGAWTWWAAPWPDKNISSFLVDVFFCNSLVDRHVGAYVDGGRAALPYPKPSGFADLSEYVGTKDAPPIGWEVTRWHVDFFRLIDGFDHPAGSYDQYIGQAQFVVDDSEMPGGDDPIAEA